jgi:hypothetical protein
MKTTMLTMLAATALAALSGCSDPITLDFSVESTPPGTAYFSSDTIEIEEGLVVVAAASPTDDDHEQLDAEVALELEVADPRILAVNRLEYPDEEDSKDDDRRRGDWFFTFAAESVGTTFLEYYVDGEFEGEVEVRVIEAADLE